MFRDVALAAIGGTGPFRGDLTHLSYVDLLDLFVCLRCPGEDEMAGEFSAQMLAGRNPLVSLVGDIAVHNPFVGFWVGKAFSGQGRGYNYFRRFGRIVRSQPMATVVGPSRFDGAPCFQLHYRAFLSLCGAVNMVDEIRRVRPGLYLGMGTVGYTRRQRSIRMPFQLVGPNTAYTGDIGTVNPLYRMSTRPFPASDPTGSDTSRVEVIRRSRTSYEELGE